MKKGQFELRAAKRELAAISIDLKAAAKEGAEEFEDCATVNEMLRIYYGVEDATLNTFRGWLQQGKVVKKGEHGYKFWSAPLKGKAKEDASEDNAGETQEERAYKFFSVCYLFSEAQVTDREQVTELAAA